MGSNKCIKKKKLPTGFGQRLEDAIIRSGKLYTHIENETGVNHSNIYEYVNETMAPSAFNLYRLCVCLQVSADYLLGLKEEYN